jgi:hypothetical protein
MLLRLQFLEREFLSGFERGQFVLQFLVFFVFAFFGFFVDAEEAVELQHRSGHAEPENFAAIFRVDVDRGLVEDCGVDLRGDETLPDQFVDLELVFF